MHSFKRRKKEKQKPVSLKSVLDEMVKKEKITNFINSWLWSTLLFNILCDEMESLHMALLLHPEVGSRLEENHTCNCLSCEPNTLKKIFFKEHSSYLREQTVVSQPCIFGRHFLEKWMKFSCHFKENNQQHFLPMIKLELPNEN